MRAARKMIVWPIVAIPLVAFSTGCANTPKTPTLTVGGAVAGAVVGARVAGPTGAVVGAVIGGVAGHSLGTYLDEADMKKMSALEMNAIQSGKPVSFVADKSKAKVTLVPEAEKKEQMKSYSLASGVAMQPLAIQAPTQVVAKYDTPVYWTTNAKQEPRTTLKKGTDIAIPALVENNAKWGAVVEGDSVIGYVPLAALNQKPPAKPAKAKTIVAKAPAEAAPAAKDSPQPAAGNSGDVKMVHAVGVCKTVTRTVETSSKDSFTEQVKYCKEPPKGWKSITV